MSVVPYVPQHRAVEQSDPHSQPHSSSHSTPHFTTSELRSFIAQTMRLYETPFALSPVHHNRQVAVQPRRSRTIWDVIRRAVAHFFGWLTTAAGVAVCAIPLPGTSLIGVPMILGGATLVGIAECKEAQSESERLAIETDRYTILNEQHTELTRAHYNALRYFSHTLYVLQEQIVATTEQNRVFETNNRALQTQVSGLTQQNREFGAHNATLLAQVNRIIQEGNQNRGVIAHLQTIATQLTGTSTTFIAGLEQNQRHQTLDQEAVQQQLTHFGRLLTQLEGETVQPLIELARRFQETVVQVLHIAAIETQIREATGELSEKMGELRATTQLVQQQHAQYQALNREHQQQVDRLRAEIDRLEGERERLRLGVIT